MLSHVGFGVKVGGGQLEPMLVRGEVIFNEVSNAEPPTIFFFSVLDKTPKVVRSKVIFFLFIFY